MYSVWLALPFLFARPFTRTVAFAFTVTFSLSFPLEHWVTVSFSSSVSLLLATTNLLDSQVIFHGNRLNGIY
jgi:hypothetical protein